MFWVYNIYSERKLWKMKAVNSWIKFIVLIWCIWSITISIMLTFQPKDSESYYWASTHHRGILAIEVEKSIASEKGNYGFNSDGYYIAYNKYRNPGSTVYSVFVYNPFTDYNDDIILAYDSGMIR